MAPQDLETQRVRDHYDAVARRYGEQYRPSAGGAYPANLIRLQILLSRLAESQSKRVYEVGVGEGTPLVEFAKAGLEVAGCDLSPEMVALTQENLRRAGLAPEVVQVADIEDSATFANQLSGGSFDAVVAVGVLPHVADDKVFLRSITSLLRPGGRCFIEFRNAFFSLFTFNRLTKEFVLDDLLAGVADDVREAVTEDLDRRLALEFPPVRSRPDGGPSYDEIRAKFHNPLQLLEEFEAVGFRDPVIHWYHYHPAPPMLETTIGAAFRREALALEGQQSHWRGFFLCSAGVVEARLP
jgi:SAM-dependent methyltransferase